MKQIWLSIVFTLYAAMIQGHLFAQDLKKQFQDVMNEIYPAGQPGAALLVLVNGEEVIRQGFGLADLDSRKKISDQTNFRLASMSKQFTAQCILLLQEEKKLSIEDPISKYLKDLPECTHEITIRQLLTHTSGIQDYESLIPPGRKEQVSDADVLEMIRKTDSLYFQPGTQFRYSNTGFCLLTQIVENITGEPYPYFVQKHIFGPLQMDASSIMQKGKEIPDRAFGYHDKNGKWTFADQSITSATMGDGCVYTSLNDYEKWIKGLWIMQSAPWLKDEFNPMLPHQKINTTLDYGYGWFTAMESDGSRSNFHSGESTGFHNIVYQNPSKQLLIVLLSNSDDQRIATAFEKVARSLHIEFPGQSKGQNLFDYLSKIYGD